YRWARVAAGGGGGGWGGGGGGGSRGRQGTTPRPPAAGGGAGAAGGARRRRPRGGGTGHGAPPLPGLQTAHPVYLAEARPVPCNEAPWGPPQTTGRQAVRHRRWAHPGVAGGVAVGD